MRIGWVALAACAGSIDRPTAVVPEEILDRVGVRDGSAPAIRIATSSAYCVTTPDVTVVPGKIATILDEYPERVLAASQIREIGLCMSFPARNVDGIAEVGRHRILILAGDEHVAAIVHHEVFHMLDYERGSMTWRSFDTIGPQHGGHRGARRPPGYVDHYAATNPSEDRASTFEYLMANPDELCAIAEGDSVVRAKAALIWRFVAEIAGTDEFLRERVSCARWLAT
jgi:hypothetical protein